MSEESAVHSPPEIVSGEPVFVGTRVPARNLMEWIEGGCTLDEFLENFPSVSRDQVIDYLEERIPGMIMAAGSRAYDASLASGNHVMVVEDGAIYEIAPEGTRRYIKLVEPSIRVDPGTKRMFR
jgi:uncharacterized protein (DUF433 family)